MESLELHNDFLHISEEDYHMAIARYKMTDKMVRESMETIKQWYNMQSHLPAGALSDDRLFRHLLAVSFSIEKAKTKIDNLLTSRSLIPEMMQNRDPCAEWLQNCRKFTRMALLPQIYRKDMTRILVFDFTEDEPTDFNMTDLFKTFIMTCDYRLCIDVTQGEHYIFNLGRTKLGHVIKVTPTMITKGIFLLQSCFGAKIKGIHFVNVPSYAEYVISLIKTGLNKKLASRLHVYRNNESLHEVFPKSMLPNEMGGENKSMAEFADATFAELCKPRWRQWFIEQDWIKTDESKRIGLKSDMSNEFLGMHGSFRTLDID